MSRLAFLFFLLFPTLVFSQDAVQRLVKEGVALHEKGKFDQAIAKYEEAYALDKNSSLVCYELGLTHYAKHDYKSAVKYFDKVINNKEAYLLEAYVAKGSAQDDMGKPKQAIETYKQAVKDLPENYLLNFNLALTEFNNGLVNDAEENLKRALTLNSYHPTSNYLMALVKMQQGRRVEALLALHYFLMLEPDSPRSKDALSLIDELITQGISKKGENEIVISALPMDEKDDFAGADLLLSLLGAAAIGEEGEGTEQEQFCERTKMVLGLTTTKKDEGEGFWFDLYVDFYAELLESDHLEAYCYIIGHENGETEQKWLAENPDKLEGFYDWLNE